MHLEADLHISNKGIELGAHHTFFISLLTKGVSNAGSSGVEGQLLGRGGESR